MTTASKGEPGLAVDSRGNPVIDPTKNVEDLVKALRETLQEFRSGDQRYLDSQLAWAEKLGNFARNADTKMVELAAQAESRLRDSLRNADRAMADAETRRIDQLSLTSERFETTIRNMLAESVRTTSDLVSNQLVQIQATFNERVSKLEAGAFTQAGKSSVADPQLTDTLARMNATLSALGTSGDRTGGREEQAKDTSTRFFSIAALAVAVLASIVIPFVSFVVLRGH